MECYCKLRNIQDKLSEGKTPYERRFGIPFNGPVTPFGAMVEHHTISAKDLSRLHQFGKKVLPGFFPWICIERAENLERRHISSRHWRAGIHARRLNAKEVWTPMKNEKCVLRTSTLIRDRPEREEEQEILRGESGGLSSSTPHQGHSTQDDAEAENDSGPLQEILLIAIM